jgi:two-component system, cell cycle sensor histidine kinase and response regulator CckA
MFLFVCDKRNGCATEPHMSEAISDQPPANNSRSGETILLVEDETFVREITCQVLESAGYLVLQASNAEEALWTFCQHEGPVHLLLTDMVMPGKNGPDLAAQLGALSPEMKTILTSGYGENIAIEIDRNPRIFFLPKPFSVQSLTRKVRDVLDEREPREHSDYCFR